MRFTDAGPSGADGTVTLDTAGTTKGRVTLEFCVTAVRHTTLADYEPTYGDECGSL